MRKPLYTILFILLFVATPAAAREQHFSPAVGDALSQKGSERAIVTEEGGVSLLHADGSLAKGFPIFVKDHVPASSPLLVNMSGDAYDEVVFVSRKNDGSYWFSVYSGTGKLLDSISLGNKEIYFDPVKVALKGKTASDVFVTDVAGNIIRLHMNDIFPEKTPLVKTLIKNVKSPAAVAVNTKGDEVIVTYPEKNAFEVYSLTGNTLGLKKKLDFGSPFLYQVVYNTENTVVYGVNRKKQLVAVDLVTGKVVAGFPVSLGTEPIGAPVLTEMNDVEKGKEIVVSISDGSQKVISQTGKVLASPSDKLRFANQGVAAAEVGGGFFTGIRDFAINIFKSTTQTLVSFFGRIKALVIVVNPDIEMTYKNNSLGSGASVTFNKVTVGGSDTKTFTITNKGNDTLSLTGIPVVSIVGQDKASFAVLKQPKTSLEPGESDTILVQFSPVTGGSKAASFRIENNDKDENPFIIKLVGPSELFQVSISATPKTGKSPLGVEFKGFTSGGLIKTPQKTDFSKYTIKSSGGDSDTNGKHTVNGKELQLFGQTSKYLDYAYDITKDTMLEFSFKSTKTDALHGVGVATDKANTLFQLAGTDASETSDFSYYDYVGTAYTTYKVQLGQFMTGAMKKLIFTNGATTASDNTINSFFKDVQIYEGSAPAYVYSWDFDNDGKFDVVGKDQQEPYYTFTKVGKHTVKLSVTDGKNTVVKTIDVTVQ